MILLNKSHWTIFVSGKKMFFGFGIVAAIFLGITVFLSVKFGWSNYGVIFFQVLTLFFGFCSVGSFIQGDVVYCNLNAEGLKLLSYKRKVIDVDLAELKAILVGKETSFAMLTGRMGAVTLSNEGRNGYGDKPMTFVFSKEYGANLGLSGASMTNNYLTIENNYYAPYIYALRNGTTQQEFMDSIKNILQELRVNVPIYTFGEYQKSEQLHECFMNNRAE